MICEKIYLK